MSRRFNLAYGLACTLVAAFVFSTSTTRAGQYTNFNVAIYIPAGIVQSTIPRS
jgi:hypothetical protein